MPALLYKKRAEIEDVRWNECITAAANGLIYGYTFYLDAMCSNWDAIVLDDYSAVMPLPWRKKWGVHYLYQPFAVAQLGVFGNGITPELLYGFLKKIPPHFQYWDFPLNFNNRFGNLSFSLYERKNFVLSLHQTYTDIAAQYRIQLKRNLKKSVSQNCRVQKDVAVDDVIALAQKQPANSGTTADYAHFKRLYQALAVAGNAVTYAAVSEAGEVLASAVFFFSHNRAYYILPGNHPKSRTAGASHFVIDRFIQDHAGQDLILDFEGSDVPGLQFFYSSFGAVEEPYAAIRHNRLPWFIKWLKR